MSTHCCELLIFRVHRSLVYAAAGLLMSVTPGSGTERAREVRRSLQYDPMPPV